MNSTPTPTPTLDFESAVSRYLSDLTELAEATRRRWYPNSQPKAYQAMVGPRYLRVIVTDAGGVGRSAHSFIDRNTGDVYKPASWKGPAKGVRGNIFRYAKVSQVASEYSANYAR
jgi:hypothetical protein